MNRKVLIIDDDPTIHVLVGAHLGNWKTELCSAYDGESGLAMVAHHRPDLVLLDVDMPGLKGHEVFRRMKSNPATHDTPVVFLTAECSTGSKVLGLDMGAVDYVAKPFEPLELRARAKAAFRAKDQIEQAASKAMIDPLTGLYNRVFFERHLGAVLARARRSSRPLACIIVEVDGFDAIVKEFDREAGDEALRGVAAALEQTCREEDVVCRYADHQFAVLASDADVASITQMVERLRTVVGWRPIVRGDLVRNVTATCGLSVSRFSFGRSIVVDAEDALAIARHASTSSAQPSGALAESPLPN